MLLGHAHDELLHLIGDTRSAQLLPLRPPVELPRDALLIPAQEGVRRDQRGNLVQARATKRRGACRKAAAFRVGEPQAVPPAVRFEDAVLFVEGGDDVLLVPLEPTGDHGDEDRQDHGVPQVASRDVMVCSSILSS